MRDSKPHLKLLSNGCWRCTSSVAPSWGWAGYGPTPKKAYDDWERAVRSYAYLREPR